MMAYFFILALRSRHICFFTAANPGIKMGGNGVESKYDTVMKIPEQYRPKSVLAAQGQSFEIVLKTNTRKRHPFSPDCQA